MLSIFQSKKDNKYPYYLIAKDSLIFKTTKLDWKLLNDMILKIILFETQS